MFGNDRGAAREISLLVVFQTKGRGFRYAPGERTKHVGIDDRVADNVHPNAAKRIERPPKIVKGNILRLHQRHQLLRRKIRRTDLDHARRRIDDVPGRKDYFAAITLEHIHFFQRAWMNAAVVVLIPFGKIIRLQKRQVFERRGIVVDDHIIDDLQCGQIHRAQLLRNERPKIGLLNVGVAGKTSD